jgi:DNA-binding SARP family transcriptional activator
MPPRVEFGLLGPLVVRRDGVMVAVPKGKQRSLLAALLLHADCLVTVDQLAELLWATEAPPPSAAVTVRNYVMRLRRTLGAVGQDRIMTQPSGYLIHVDPGELDIAAMERSLAAARGAAWEDDWQGAASHATAALDRWRGEPLPA